jgi:hypothetical protein
MGVYRSHLDVRVLPDREGQRLQWALLAPFRFWSDVVTSELIVPAGFTTDGESIPWLIVSLSGPASLRAGVIHDWWVRARIGDHDTGARVYEEALIADGVDRRWAALKAWYVERYGRKAWETGPNRLRILAPDELAALRYAPEPVPDPRSETASQPEAP